jgi:hypothetical protein
VRLKVARSVARSLGRRMKHTLRLTATDAAGNRSAAKRLTFKLVRAR